MYELLELDDAMLDALRKNDTALFTQEAKNSDLYLPLSLCALDYAIEGRTSIQEVFKISASLDDATALTKA